MKACLVCLGLLLTACSSVLGLDSSNYVSTEDQLCKHYSEVCLNAAPGPDAGILPDAGLGGDPGTCKEGLDHNTARLTVQSADTCLGKIDCATFNTCILFGM